MAKVKGFFKKAYRLFKNNKKASYLSLLAIPLVLYFGVYLYSLTQNHTYKLSKEDMEEGASFDDFNLVVQDQKYNPKNGTYVIKVRADTDNDEKVVLDSNNLSVKAITNKDRKSYQPNVYHTLNDYFVVEIEDIPKDYGSLKLHFNYKDSKNGDDDSNRSGDLYVSAVGKNIDKNLTPQSKKTYYRDSYIYLKNRLEKEIEDKKRDIKYNKENIHSIKRENKKLDANDPILSKKEQRQTQSTIDDNNSSIESSKENISHDKKAIKEKQKNKENVEKVINDL